MSSNDVVLLNNLLASWKVSAPSGLDDATAFELFVIEHEKRSLLCRVIVTEDATTRDRIIKATNFQTAVSAASLRATDPIQRNIEEYFHAQKWYYDRRKNYYRNLGMAAERIVGVPYLAQAVMAMGLSQPDSARARPTTLIKDDDQYDRIFNEKMNLGIYLWCARTMKAVDAFLRSAEAPGTDDERREFRFHLASWLVIRALKKKIHSPSQLSSLLSKTFTKPQMKSAMSNLIKHVQSYSEYGKHPLDRIAKSIDFVDFLYGRMPKSWQTKPTKKATKAKTS